MGIAVVDVWFVAAGVGEQWLTERATFDGRGLPAELDVVEERRARQLRQDQRAAFVVARVMLRRVLGERLALAPDDVPLVASCAVCGKPHGRVQLEGIDGLWVSLTRSSGVLALALTDAGPVGIDVESVASVQAAPVADVALSPRERLHVQALAPDDRQNAVAVAWVRKEAALKALGTGLRRSPSDLELLPLVGGAAVRGVPDLEVADLEVGAGIVGAVAVVPRSAEPGGAATDGRSRVEVRTHEGEIVLDREQTDQKGGSSGSGG